MAYLVRSLVNLRAEIDARWPNRTRAIDGWYRSPSVGISVGHNPDYKGAVHAIDVDRRGIDPLWIVHNAYRGGRVLYYMIWNRRIYSRSYGFAERVYTGSNPHTDHIHIEVYQTSEAENYSGGWQIAPATSGVGVAGPVAEGVGAAYDHSLYILHSGNYFEAGGNLYRGYSRMFDQLR